jgi:hypothetical protein
MNTNGLPAIKTDLLDRALADQPPATKARVLDLVLKLGVSPEDEFWLIFIALGQLQVLIEDSPNDWQTLFEDFQQELSQWTTTNIQTLELLASKTQAMSQLAARSTELTSILSALVSTCSTLMQHLQTSDATLNSSLSKWQSSSREWNGMQDSIQRDLQTMRLQLSAVEHRLNTGTSQTFTARPWLVAVLLVLVSSTTAFGWLTWRNHQTLQRSAQQIDWLLHKNNRRDCADGFLPDSNPLCR